MERKIDKSIRIKVTNECQWTCNFCHNEGTELPNGHNGDQRVSVFLDPRILTLPRVGSVTTGKLAESWINAVKSIGIDEAHLTGGEPTLLLGLPTLVRQLRDADIAVKVTTNGQGSPRRYREIIDAGVSGLTFSVLSLDPAEFLLTQNPPPLAGLDPLSWANRMIEREKGNIILAKSLGVDVKINTAILGDEDYPRVDRVRQFAEENGIALVLLPSVGEQEDTGPVVFNYVREKGSYLARKEAANNSNSSEIYITPSGHELRTKYLRQYYPDVVCGGCEHQGLPSCLERFYGVRMEFREGQPWVRLCIQKSTPQTLIPLSTFIEKDIFSQL